MDADREIVRLVQSAHEDDQQRGMELLLAAYGTKIDAAVRLFSPGVDRHGQEDIRQEAVLRIRKSIRSHYRHEGKLWAYLKRVVRGVATDCYRRAARIDRRTTAFQDPEREGFGAPEPAAPSSDQPDAQAMRLELIRSVRKEVGRLHPRCREIIHLHYQEELKYREIARTLGISVGTVSSRLARCLDRLSKGLEDVTSREELHASPR
jgi:RNA polymerase sigma-70 factor (ECF subfamily)